MKDSEERALLYLKNDPRYTAGVWHKMPGGNGVLDFMYFESNKPPLFVESKAGADMLRESQIQFVASLPVDHRGRCFVLYQPEPDVCYLLPWHEALDHFRRPLTETNSSVDVLTLLKTQPKGVRAFAWDDQIRVLANTLGENGLTSFELTRFESLAFVMTGRPPTHYGGDRKQWAFYPSKERWSSLILQHKDEITIAGLADLCENIKHENI
jgi:hypothetical protein